MAHIDARPMKTRIITTVVVLGALLLPCLSFAQTADEILKHAQERIAQDENNEASWSAESRESADRALDNLKAERCSDKDIGPLCAMIVLCGRAPEIAGERLPDNKELTAAKQALDDAGDDFKKMASAIAQVKIASAQFEKGARAARDRCEAKVRMAYRSISQSAKSASDEAVEATKLDEIYNGPVAIRPMVTAPQLVSRVPPLH